MSRFIIIYSEKGYIVQKEYILHDNNVNSYFTIPHLYFKPLRIFNNLIEATKYKLKMESEDRSEIT